MNLLKTIKKLIKQAMACALYYGGIFTLYRRFIESHCAQNNVIILRFHRILANGKTDITGISIKEQTFEALIKFLKNNFDIVTLKEAVSTIEAGERCKHLTFAFTFDDGYKDNFFLAYPVLKENKIPVTIFLTADAVGKENTFWWDRQEIEKDALTKKDIELLTWDDIGAMNSNGISFGSHTLTHPFLTKISAQQAEEEIAESKRFLEEQLGKPVIFFTYPHGDYNSIIAKTVKQAGYRAAFTTQDTRCCGSLFKIGRKGLSEEIITDIHGRFCEPLVMFALLKNVR